MKQRMGTFTDLGSKLDDDFHQLERLSGQLQRVTLESDSQIDHAVKLLVQFTAHAQGISDGIQEFARSLEAARVSSETAAASVAERALEIQARRDEQARLREKFSELAVRVKEVSASIAGFQGEPAQISVIEGKLEEFGEEAKAIRDEAREGRMKGIERDAESLHDTLQSARRKLSKVLKDLG